MAVFRFRVTYLDGRKFDTTAGPGVQVRTEREMRGLGDHNRLDALYRMAKNALAAEGKDHTDYDPWLEQVADVEEIGEEEDAAGRTESDPTNQAQSPDNSSN